MPAAAVGAVAIGASVYSGNKAAKAAKKASQQQVNAANNDIAFQTESRDLAIERQQPYNALGVSNMSSLQQMLSPQGQFDYLQQNPLFQMALDRADRQTNNAFLGAGRVGDAREAIAQSTILAAQPLLDRQTNNLFNAVNLGQAAASGQANATLTTGQTVGNTLSDIGNAKAAGVIGSANAKADMINQIAGLAGMGAGMFGGNPMLSLGKKTLSPNAGSAAGGYGGFYGY